MGLRLLRLVHTELNAAEFRLGIAMMSTVDCDTVMRSGTPMKQAWATLESPEQYGAIVTGIRELGLCCPQLSCNRPDQYGGIAKHRRNWRWCRLPWRGTLELPNQYGGFATNASGQCPRSGDSPSSWRITLSSTVGLRLFPAARVHPAPWNRPEQQGGIATPVRESVPGHPAGPLESP